MTVSVCDDARREVEERLVGVVAAFHQMRRRHPPEQASPLPWACPRRATRGLHAFTTATMARVMIALSLVAVLVALAYRLRRFRLPTGALALAAAVLLIANVQGAVSPFGTLLPILASGPADADLAAVLAQVHHQLKNDPASPALDVMLAEYVRWHVVKAVLVGLLATVLVGLSVVAWRRRRLVSLLTGVTAAAALVVVAANVTTAANPIPPFLLLLRSS